MWSISSQNRSKVSRVWALMALESAKLPMIRPATAMATGPLTPKGTARL